MVKINDTIIGNECFPNNERILKSIRPTKAIRFIIDFKYETDLDISILIMCKKYLDDKFQNPEVILNMKYVPYSRMDRQIEGHMFSLKYFCDFINQLNFSKIYVLDTHSNVTTALLNRVIELPVQDNINKILSNFNVDYIFYPDNGAMKRYSEILKVPVPYFHGNKKRNLQTGEIVEYELVNCPNIKNKSVLIIDDLCAFGKTFLEASEKLKENDVSNIMLYVSHCENSIYKGKLLDSNNISTVFTTDSILNDWSSSKIVNVEYI